MREQRHGRLWGRERELATFAAHIDELPSGGVGLLIEGEPGVGKTALTDAVTMLARRRRLAVLRATGVLSESQLPFAALHQLLLPLQSRVPELPAPQLDSLRAAFGMGGGESDIFLNALAALTLLSDHAEEDGLLVVVEDVQWLDSGTLTVLDFLSRRLDAEPILLLCTARTGEIAANALGQLTRMRLEPLDEATASALLDAQSMQLPSEVRRLVLDQALGNPLAIVELAANAENAPPRVDAPLELPLTDRLEAAFASRYASLSRAARIALLVAAINESDSLAEVYTAMAALSGADYGDEILDEAIAAGLVTVGSGRIAFRHPLVRSAIRQSARESLLRQAHLALASTIDKLPDRQIWHRAAAATGPDEEVAASLREVGDRSQAHGDLRSAETAYRRAAQLSADPVRHSELLLLSAEAAQRAGHPEVSSELLDELDALQPAPVFAARARLVRELAPDGALRIGADIRPVMGAVESLLAAGATDEALAALCQISSLVWATGMGAEADAEVIQAAHATGVPDADPRMLHISAFSAPLSRGDVVRAAISEMPAAGLPHELALLFGMALGPTGGLEQAEPYLRVALSGLARRGALPKLVQTQLFAAWNQLHRGRFLEAAASADESARLAIDIGEPLLALPARLTAAVAQSSSGIRADFDAMVPGGPGGDALWIRPFRAMRELAEGAASLALGEYEVAYAHTSRLIDPASPAYHSEYAIIALADHVEAAARSGRAAEARAAVAAFEDAAARTGHQVLHSGLALARPLAARPGDAERAFEEALSEPPVMPFIRARLDLAYGSWLRRQRRIAQARIALQRAHDAFAALGTGPWVLKAGIELGAAGVQTAEVASTGSVALLTPQEHRIATLVAEGLTNRQIGERLFLSHRTVSTHLHAIFPKLGITSRDQLGALLGGRLELTSRLP